MTGVLIVIGYLCYAIAAGFVLLNVIYKYQTLRTGRPQSAVFLVTSICAFIGCQILGVTPRGCNYWIVVLFVVLDFGTPFVAEWVFTLVGVGPRS